MEKILTRKFWSLYSDKDLPTKGGEFNYVVILNYKRNKVLKIGTTKDLLNRFYALLGEYEVDIIICWISNPYTKYTTLKAEDKNREIYKSIPNWEWVRLDRFRIPDDVSSIIFTVRKDYIIPIKKL